MDIVTAISKAKDILIKNSIKSAELDCEILMSEVINKDRKYIILNPNENLEKKKVDFFYKLVEERSTGKPVAYLTKKKIFGNLNFM